MKEVGELRNGLARASVADMTLALDMGLVVEDGVDVVGVLIPFE